MKEFLSNVWVKRCVSVFNAAYYAVVLLLTYATFLYKLEFVEGRQTAFLSVFCVASALFLILMIYTREVPLTKAISILMAPTVFFLIIFNMGSWALIIPPFIVGIVMFFVASTSETAKVIMGTIYLLLYVLGLVAFFVLNMLFDGSSVETKLDVYMDKSTSAYNIYSSQMQKISEVTSDSNTISPDGKYQFYLTDLKDSNKGCVKIYVVPYGEDIELKFFTLKQKGIRKTITNKGTRGVVPDVGWIVQQDENGNQNLAVQYKLSDSEEVKITGVNKMPDKQYLDFLGIN